MTLRSTAIVLAILSTWSCSRCEDPAPEFVYPEIVVDPIWGVSPTDRGTIFEIDYVEGTYWAVGARGKILKSTDGGFNWDWVPSPVGTDLRSVDFINPSVGMIAGAVGEVWGTRDGGDTWYKGELWTNFQILNFTTNKCEVPTGFQNYKRTDVSGTIQSIRMIDENTAVMGGLGLLEYTTDGGKTWYWANDCKGSYRPNADETINKIELSPSRNMWAVSDTGLVVTALSSSKGEVWADVTPPVPPAFTAGLLELNDIEVLDDDVVFVTGAFGRVSWTVTGARPCDGNTGPGWASYRFPSNVTFESLAMLSKEEGGFVATKKGGIFQINPTVFRNVESSMCDWLHYDISDVAAVGFGIEALYWINGKGFAVGEDGRIARCPVPDGKTWLEKTISYNVSYKGVATIDEEKAWFVGTQGRTYYTSDGGTTLEEKLIPGIGFQLNDVAAIDENRAVVVGQLGTIAYTSNRGDNWDFSPSGTTRQLNSITYNRTLGQCMVVGDQGTILAPRNLITGAPGTVLTTCLGTEWQQISAGTGEHLYDVAIDDSGTIWVVGGLGTLLRGQLDNVFSWQPVNLQTNEDLVKIGSADGVSRFLLGRAGRVYKWTDGVVPFWFLDPQPPMNCQLLSVTSTLECSTDACIGAAIWPVDQNLVYMAGNCGASRLLTADTWLFTQRLDAIVSGTSINDMEGTPGKTRVYAVGNSGALLIAKR